MYTIELNNAQRSDMLASGKINEKSACVEIFSKIVDGKDTSKYGKKVDAVVKYYNELSDKANADDKSAIAEINELRKFTIQPQLLQELKLLSVFGSYKALAWGDTPELETISYENIRADIQAEGQDVPTGFYKTKKTRLAPVTISGGYKVNYREAKFGDLQKENELKAQVITQIKNKANLYIMQTALDEITNATGVKYFYENAGLAKASVDGLLTKIRRYGKPTVIGDYAVISQFTPWAGYTSAVSGIKDISEKQLNEIAETGLLGSYNGTILKEMPNAYDFGVVETAADGTKNYGLILPAGLAVVVPTAPTKGVSPIQSFSIGGLTSFTGNSVATGDILTRFDISLACGVAKDYYGNIDGVALIHDSNLDTL